MSPQTICERPGCGNRANTGHRWCCALCRLIDAELDYTRHLIGKTGTSPTATDTWTAAVQMSDCFTVMRHGQRQLKALAAQRRTRRHREDRPT